MNTSNVKVWPHLTIVAVICAVVAGLGVGWWVRHESTASANAIPNAARIQRVDGDVALNNAASNSDGADANWVPSHTESTFQCWRPHLHTRELARKSRVHR
jgi:hypothetical protein